MLVPGTGNFFCGSCLRDHSLAKELIKNNCDITMVPLYLPHVAEDDFNTAPLFFGGINVYLQQFRIFRHLPNFITKLFDSEHLLSFISRFSGFTSAKTLGELTLASLNIENSSQKIEFDKMLNWLKENIKPDCVVLSNCLLAGFAKPLKGTLNCPILCTLQGEDTFLDSLVSPFKEQCWKVLKECCEHIDSFLPVSNTHDEIMRKQMGYEKDKSITVYNGIELKEIKATKNTNSRFTIGFLANIIPEKGLSDLIDAFILLRNQNLDVELMILGSITPFTKDYLKSEEAKLQRSGLIDFVEIHTNLSKDEKFEYLSKATILSVPATYGESFGLYLLEALALKIPVVQPEHGAFPEILDKLKGGLLYEAKNTQDLADKIHHLFQNPDIVEELGNTGYQNLCTHFTVEAMASQVSKIIDEKISETH
jgi:glycosyltransferase involved in cell wall biosynthesis